MNTGDPIAILGMNRSGTSCLAGTLESHGLALGDVANRSAHNQKGNKENKAFRQLNDAILAHSGGSWDKPPTIVQWTKGHCDARDHLLGEYSSKQPWGFKDPRTILTFEFWREAVPYMPVIATFRNPLSVSLSLKARPGLMPAMEPQALWAHYNQKLLDILTKTTAPIVCFDWDRDRYVRCTSLIARRLGLAVQPSTQFREDALNHQAQQNPGDAITSPQVKEIYDALMAKAIDTERAIKEHTEPT